MKRKKPTKKQLEALEKGRLKRLRQLKNWNKKQDSARKNNKPSR